MKIHTYSYASQFNFGGDSDTSDPDPHDVIWANRVQVQWSAVSWGRWRWPGVWWPLALPSLDPSGAKPYEAKLPEALGYRWKSYEMQTLKHVAPLDP